MENLVKDKKIPQTDSIEELAQFWDLHDLTDFKDELEEVDEPIFQHAVTIPLTPEDAAVVNTLAEARGVSPRALIEEWVAESIAAVSLTTPKEISKTK
jgi:hypothetical protein